MDSTTMLLILDVMLGIALIALLWVVRQLRNLVEQINIEMDEVLDVQHKHYMSHLENE